MRADHRSNDRLILTLVAVLFAQINYGSRFADNAFPDLPLVPILTAVAAGACIVAAVHPKWSWWVIARTFSMTAIAARLVVVLATELQPGRALNDRPGSAFLVVGIDGLTLLGLWALFERIKPGGTDGGT